MKPVKQEGELKEMVVWSGGAKSSIDAYVRVKFTCCSCPVDPHYGYDAGQNTNPHVNLHADRGGLGKPHLDNQLGEVYKAATGVFVFLRNKHFWDFGSSLWFPRLPHAALF